MRSRAINAKARQKKSSGNDLPLLECLSTPFRLNSLFDLFIQQLWNNIGSISGKVYVFLLRGMAAGINYTQSCLRADAHG
ncbi:Uncharacterised protein [Salmonella sp. NCTC 11881]|nr:Uncharacterised protein [Salmonella sp. NCTC 11881]